MSSYVVYSEENGIFLGHFMGLGIWSKLDPAGQAYACAFSDEREAETFIREFCKPDCRAVPVNSADGYASVVDCIAAGLPGWEVEDEED